MIQEWLAEIPDESPLVNEELKAQISQVFSKLDQDITLVTVVDRENGTCKEMASFLKAISALNSHISLVFKEKGEEPELDRLLSAELLPATGLFRDSVYLGAAFHGVPGGKEINSFVLAVYNGAGPGQPVEEKIRKCLGKLKTNNNLKVCVSLSCHHCPKVVAAGQRLALLSEKVSCEMIDARLYPELVERWNLNRVPAVIVNDQDIYLGEKDMEELLRLMK